MPAEIVPSAPGPIELQGVPTDILKARLREAIGMTAEAIRTVAMLWRELSRRGEDLSEFRLSLAPFLALVADGRLMAELVVRMSGQPRALQRLAELPVADQDRLLRGEILSVYHGDAGSVHKTLAEMSFAEIALVVRDGRILTAKEQKLAHDRMRTVRARVRGRPPRLAITAANEIMVGKVAVPAERVIALLRERGLI
jgi:hypothetical protein